MCNFFLLNLMLSFKHISLPPSPLMLVIAPVEGTSPAGLYIATFPITFTKPRTTKLIFLDSLLQDTIEN